MGWKIFHNDMLHVYQTHPNAIRDKMKQRRRPQKPRDKDKPKREKVPWTLG